MSNARTLSGALHHEPPTFGHPDHPPEGRAAGDRFPRGLVDPGPQGASIARDSFRTMGMLIAPCSVYTLAEVATGVTTTLLTRTADVALKKRRRLVMMVSEAPLHAGHKEHAGRDRDGRHHSSPRCQPSIPIRGPSRTWWTTRSAVRSTASAWRCPCCRAGARGRVIAWSPGLHHSSGMRAQARSKPETVHLRPFDRDRLKVARGGPHGRPADPAGRPDCEPAPSAASASLHEEVDIPPVKPYVEPLRPRLHELVRSSEILEALPRERLQGARRESFGLAVSRNRPTKMLRRSEVRSSGGSETALAALHRAKMVACDDTNIRMENNNSWHRVSRCAEAAINHVAPTLGTAMVRDIKAYHRSGMWLSDRHAARHGHADRHHARVSHLAREVACALKGYNETLALGSELNQVIAFSA